MGQLIKNPLLSEILTPAEFAAVMSMTEGVRNVKFNELMIMELKEMEGFINCRSRDNSIEFDDCTVLDELQFRVNDLP